MASHSETVTATEELSHACGHVGKFLCYSKDPYQKERRAKFVKRQCDQCQPQPAEIPKAKLAPPKAKPATKPEVKPVAPVKPKADAVKSPPSFLPKNCPIGTQIVLTRVESGDWHGSLDVIVPGPDSIDMTGPTPDGLLTRLASAIQVAKGVKPV